MRKIKTSFNAGVYTPEAYGRLDIQTYDASCRELTNFIATPHGPAVRRPGFEYIAAVKTSANFTRLIPFIFDESNSYVIEAGGNYFRFYYNGGQLKGPPDSDTKLLLHFNGPNYSTTITDDGDTGHSPTTSGNAKLSTLYKKFGTASLYLDGSGDFVDVPDHADFAFGASEFTIDFWFRPRTAREHAVYSHTATDGSDFIEFTINMVSNKHHLWARNSGTLLSESFSYTFSINTWYHVALIRGWGSVTNDWAITVGGVEQHTFTNAYTMPDIATDNVTIGMTEAEYDDDVQDYGATIHALTYTGGLNTTSSYTKWGNQSILNNAQAEYLAIPDSADFDISSNFTIDTWILVSAADSCFFYAGDNFSSLSDYWYLKYEIDSSSPYGAYLSFKVYESSVEQLSLSGSDLVNTYNLTWAHIMVCRVGNEWGIYLNGTQLDYASDALASHPNTAAGLRLFWWDIGNARTICGDEFRIYSGNPFSAAPASDDSDTITVPTSRHDADSNTKLLIRPSRRYLKGYLDEFRVSTTARWTAGFTPPVTEYPAGDNSGSAYEVGSLPYSVDELDVIDYVQSADVMYLAHQSNPIRKLTRTSHTSWASAEPSITNEPPSWTSDDYPQCLSFFDDRLTYAGTNALPDKVYLSAVGDYENLTTGSASADDALYFTLSARQVNLIKWTVGADRLIIGTGGSEWWAAGPSESEPITPTDKIARRSTDWGSKKVKPVDIGGTIFYVQQKGHVLRAMQYDEAKRKYISDNVSLIAKEFFDDYEIRDMAFQQNPYQILWVVLTSGDMVAMTYMPEHNVIAWHKHTTNGEFESCACIPGINDEDELWVTVLREIDDSEVRYIERMKPFNFGSDIEDAFFVDSGLTYDGEAATTISGLDHLEGESVSILADGVEVTGKTVSSGSITLSSAASKVHIGLTYNSDIETHDFQGEDKDGPMTGVIKRITNIYLNLYRSMGGTYGPDSSTTDDIPYRDTTELFSGFTEELAFDEGHSNEATVFIRQSEPFPMTVRGVTVELEED
jgi:hypothetical protein